MEEIKELKSDVASVRVDVAAVKRDTKFIRESVKKINGRVADMEDTVDTVKGKVRNFEEDKRRKELDCPYREVIVDLSENKMTQEVLKKFVQDEERRRYKESAARDRRLRWIIGAVGVVFTVITILVNLITFYLS